MTQEKAPDIRILAIDDEDIQRKIIQKLVESSGYAIRIAPDGMTGLNMAREWLPGIIFIDVYLPDGSGIELVKKFKEMPETSDSFIILMSSDISEDTTVAGLMQHANEFIYKPLRKNEFQIKLNSWAQRYSRRMSMLEKVDTLSKTTDILSQYFSKDIVEKILTSSGKNMLKGENVTATILFFDIRNFTTISESISPDKVADLLNYLYTDIMDLVFSHNGSINKIIGDAILATFGAPIVSEHDARNAVLCALDIQKTFNFFNQVKPHYLENDIAFGIGIATGKVFAGNIGSYRRMEYTVIGDTVNLASRLQELTKKITENIIIDDATLTSAELDLATKKIRVSGIRGKKEKIQIYALSTLKNLDEDEKDNEVTFF